MQLEPSADHAPDFHPSSREQLDFGGEKRGAWRWTRDGRLLYVVWKDSVDVALLTTMHAGTSDHHCVKRREKNQGK